MAEGYQGWAVVELMGHRQTAGLVSEVTLGGTTLLRVDTPAPDSEAIVASQMYGGSAIYCLTPCDEATARTVLRSAYDLPPMVRVALRASAALPAPDEDPDEDEGDEP
jgi:hypothetical protein